MRWPWSKPQQRPALPDLGAIAEAMQRVAELHDAIHGVTQDVTDLEKVVARVAVPLLEAKKLREEALNAAAGFDQMLKWSPLLNVDGWSWGSFSPNGHPPPEIKIGLTPVGYAGSGFARPVGWSETSVTQAGAPEGPQSNQFVLAGAVLSTFGAPEMLEYVQRYLIIRLALTDGSKFHLPPLDAWSYSAIPGGGCWRTTVMPPPKLVLDHAILHDGRSASLYPNPLVEATLRLSLAWNRSIPAHAPHR